MSTVNKEKYWIQHFLSSMLRALPEHFILLLTRCVQNFKWIWHNFWYHFIFQLRQKLMEKIHNGQSKIDMLLWLSKATLEIMGQGGFGYKFNALDESKKSTYSEAVKMLSYVTSKTRCLRLKRSYQTIDFQPNRYFFAFPILYIC